MPTCLLHDRYYIGTRCYVCVEEETEDFAREAVFAAEEPDEWNCNNCESTDLISRHIQTKADYPPEPALVCNKCGHVNWL